MSEMRSTLYGMYEWHGDDLFSEVEFPDGIDRETALNVIMLDCGEFEPLYTDADFFRGAAGVWSKKWNRTFKKWIDALSIEYNPLDNYNRHEEWSENRDTKGNIKSEGSEDSDGTKEFKKSAYDTPNYSPRDQESTKNGFKSEGTQDSTTEEKDTHKGHLWGNIGVTTSQKMLEDELNLQEWNIYKHISDLFAEELCLMIY